MKKRIARIVVYFSLLAFTFLILSHPYVRQSVFGPTIKGEPLWAWQEEFRIRGEVLNPNPTRWSKIAALLRLNTAPVQWIGYFPSEDPEMRPVLLSLVYDGDETTRSRAVHALCFLPPDDETIQVLTRLMDDPDSAVSLNARDALSVHGPRSISALPRMREFLKEKDPTAQMYAAVAVLRVDPDTAEALAIVRKGLFSSDIEVSRMAYHGLNKNFKDDEEVFALVKQRAIKGDLHNRLNSIVQLHYFGKKAMPFLMPLLKDDSPTELCFVINAFEGIGPDAAEVVPTLQRLVNHENVHVRNCAAAALKQIVPDPK